MPWEQDSTLKRQNHDHRQYQKQLLQVEQKHVAQGQSTAEEMLGEKQPKTVDAQRDTGRWRQSPETVEELLVDRVRRSAQLLSLFLVGKESAPLLVGIDELGEGVGQLMAGDVELEALGDTICHSG